MRWRSLLLFVLAVGGCGEPRQQLGSVDPEVVATWSPVTLVSESVDGTEQCAGALDGEGLLITAWHCVQPPPQRLDLDGRRHEAAGLEQVYLGSAPLDLALVRLAPTPSVDARRELAEADLSGCLDADAGWLCGDVDGSPGNSGTVLYDPRSRALVLVSGEAEQGGAVIDLVAALGLPTQAE